MSVIAATHTVVNSKATDRPFGAGLLRFVPYAVTAPGFVEPSDSDRRWAAEHLNEEPEPDYDTLAGESAYVDAVSALTMPPAIDRCVRCGELAEVISWGMCPDCFDIAATDAATRCQTGLRHVY